MSAKGPALAFYSATSICVVSKLFPLKQHNNGALDNGSVLVDDHYVNLCPQGRRQQSFDRVHQFWLPVR